MGHHIIGLIGAPAALADIAERADAPAPTALPFDLGIIPLGEAQLDRLTGMAASHYDDDFIYLSAELEAALCTAAETKPLLYIETEYFGGAGGQSAALFEHGKLVWKDHETSEEAPGGRSPISEGLSRMGVAPAAGSDEFDGVGLVRFRRMEDLGLVDDEDD